MPLHSTAPGKEHRSCVFNYLGPKSGFKVPRFMSQNKTCALMCVSNFTRGWAISHKPYRMFLGIMADIWYGMG